MKVSPHKQPGYPSVCYYNWDVLLLVTLRYVSTTISPKISDLFDSWLHLMSVVRGVKKKRESLSSWALPAKSFLAKFPWEIWILLQTAVYSCFHAGSLLYCALFTLWLCGLHTCIDCFLVKLLPFRIILILRVFILTLELTVIERNSTSFDELNLCKSTQKKKLLARCGTE